MTALSASALLDREAPSRGVPLARWLRAGLGFLGSTALAVVLLVVVSL